MKISYEKTFFIKKLIISGCEARGDKDKPYLTRWILLQFNKFALYLHKFHRSDADDLHDHPWNFISIILWRGYKEQVQEPRGTIILRRVYPGMIIYRPATHLHRVILLNNKPAYTLVLRFKYVRWWGFVVNGKWQLFTDYFKQNGC